MGLKDLRNGLLIGAAVSPKWLENEKYAQIVKDEFSSVTCENQMKPQYTMDRTKTLQSGSDERVCLSFEEADKALTFARDNDIKLRAHTLIWHNQTPRWFFAEDWSEDENAPLISREKLIKRMENYIRDEMSYVNATYPGLIYCWDVLNEFIEPDNGHPRGCRIRKNLWFDVLGEETPIYAFSFARKYADKNQKLFYNDYNEYEQPKRSMILKMLKPLKDKGLVDGMGLQSHILTDYPNVADYKKAIREYADEGYELNVTEMDVKSLDPSEAGDRALTERYREMFEAIVDSGKISSVTFWGATDAQSWLSKPGAPAYPLLLDREFGKKAAYFAVKEVLEG